MRGSFGRSGGFRRDVAVVDHALDHPVAALDGGLPLAEGVVVVRAFGRAAVGHLRDAEFVNGFPK